MSKTRSPCESLALFDRATEELGNELGSVSKQHLVKSIEMLGRIQKAMSSLEEVDLLCVIKKLT